MPIEWHEAFQEKTQRKGKGGSKRKPKLGDISLSTIPGLRAFANEAMLDVLYFMSPEYHQIMVQLVTHEMNIAVDRVHRFLPAFRGRISLLCHSLGSVIAWDILANQDGVGGVDNSDDDASINLGFAADNDTLFCSYPKLDFYVENCFFIGSPIAVFLMVQNKHNAIDEEYSLPGCDRVFNVFHPFDPAAYRLEPLINRRNVNIEPVVLPTWTGGFRVQYAIQRWLRGGANKLKTIRRNILKRIEKGVKDIGLLDESVNNDIVNGESLEEVDNSDNDDREDDMNVSGISSVSSIVSTTSSSVSHAAVSIRSALNDLGRIDYIIQEREIENQISIYAAMGAHTMYWDCKDLALFLSKNTK